MKKEVFIKVVVTSNPAMKRPNLPTAEELATYAQGRLCGDNRDFDDYWITDIEVFDDPDALARSLMS